MSNKSIDHNFIGSHETSALNILLVDDDPAIRLIMSMSLQKHGHNIMSADSASNALEHARSSCPDCIIVDLNLTVSGGGEALIRSLWETHAGVATILMSGDFDGIADGEIDGKPVTLLGKPFRLDRLVHALPRREEKT